MQLRDSSPGSAAQRRRWQNGPLRTDVDIAESLRVPPETTDRARTVGRTILHWYGWSLLRGGHCYDDGDNDGDCDDDDDDDNDLVRHHFVLEDEEAGDTQEDEDGPEDAEVEVKRSVLDVEHFEHVVAVLEDAQLDLLRVTRERLAVVAVDRHQYALESIPARRYHRQQL